MKKNNKRYTLIAINLITSFMLIVFIVSCDFVKDETQNKVDGSATPNTLTKAEVAAGWKLLFDGESLINWRGLGMESVPEGQWIIEDRQIKKVAKEDIPLGKNGDPVPSGDLMTIEAYENFEFSIEWKASKGGNSGIKYNVS
ncbi:DUF1080 domain-containing protein, partial [candidate division KSB1 bacterium]|nr:DUF1080 domain-containing protein [candidate division KSB1 bacterium]